ncbi:hypothetical protein ACHHYP_20588 [Achlya hypogyna]|uniref:Transmembrane protein n=1 Tax=Achlya hypogyna TaxID=1202772 RepID=A0A1V9YI05_ACHHY|nr:hypothetical protein ACHHYP_20588 [Achlya hypogyna]
MAATADAPNAIDDWADEESYTDSDGDIDADVDVIRSTAPVSFRRPWLRKFKTPKPSKKSLARQPSIALPDPVASDTLTLPRGRYRMEMVATPAPKIPFLRRFAASDFLDLILVFLLWAAIGVGIYFLDIEVPHEYKTAVWVSLGLVALPLVLFCALHLYELRLRRDHRFVKVSTN